MEDSQTYSAVVSLNDVPVVAIDHNSMFTLVNKAFEHEYGWSEKELLGRSVTEIIPPYLRDAHQIGFSRFLTTEEATLLGKRLPLGILYKDGSIQDAEHYILGEKFKKRWRFAAIITPRS